MIFRDAVCSCLGSLGTVHTQVFPCRRQRFRAAWAPPWPCPAKAFPLRAQALSSESCGSRTLLSCQEGELYFWVGRMFWKVMQYYHNVVETALLARQRERERDISSASQNEWASTLPLLWFSVEFELHTPTQQWCQGRFYYLIIVLSYILLPTHIPSCNTGTIWATKGGSELGLT